MYMLSYFLFSRFTICPNIDSSVPAYTICTWQTTDFFLGRLVRFIIVNNLMMKVHFQDIINKNDNEFI